MKPEGYFASDRAELVRQLPSPVGRVLDVGCGEGRTGAACARPERAGSPGSSSSDEAAVAAAESYDDVREGAVESELASLDGPFDTILLYDVLEHLVDPWEVLRQLHGVAAPGARVHVSIPNARHWTLLRDLALRGTFGYTRAEHRDVTHLRWFTARDLVELLESTGWTVDDVGFGALRPVSKAAARLTRDLSAGFLAYQLSALAHRR